MKKSEKLLHTTLLGSEVISKAYTAASGNENGILVTGSIAAAKDCALLITAIKNIASEDNFKKHKKDFFAIGSVVMSLGGAVLTPFFSNNCIFFAISSLGSSLADVASTMYITESDESEEVYVTEDVIE